VITAAVVAFVAATLAILMGLFLLLLVALFPARDAEPADPLIVAEPLFAIIVFGIIIVPTSIFAISLIRGGVKALTGENGKILVIIFSLLTAVDIIYVTAGGLSEGFRTTSIVLVLLQPLSVKSSETRVLSLFG